MADDTHWNNRSESDSPAKDTQKGTPTDEFIETDPNRNSQDDESNGYPAHDSNEQLADTQKGVTPSDDNPVMGSENTFNDTDPNRYQNNAGLGFSGSGEEVQQANTDAAQEGFVEDESDEGTDYQDTDSDKNQDIPSQE